MSEPLSQIETPSESHVYRYDYAKDVAIQQGKTFWFAEELGVHHDEDDLRTRLTKAELEACVYLQSILNKYEDHLGDDVWGDIIPKRFPRREIVRACRAISYVESNSHAPFYKIFNEVLHRATDEFYSSWRYDGHLYKHIRYVDQCSKHPDSLVVAAATCLLEGVNLFTVFGFFKSFNTRGFNMISHFVSGIDGSSKEEFEHAKFSAYLFNNCRKERKALGHHTEEQEEELKSIVLRMASDLYEHDLEIVRRIYAFEESTDTKIRTITQEELVSWLQDRINLVLSMLGYEPMFKKERGVISKEFYSNISSFKMSDFFANTQLQYTRSWDDSRLVFNPEVRDAL